MFSSKRLCVVCNFESSVDEATGDRTYQVSSGRKVICDKGLVGIVTQQLAQSQNMNFQYSIEIDKMFYSEQKYLYIDKNLYEIKNIASAKLPQNCKLNVVNLVDDDLKNAVERWLHASL